MICSLGHVVASHIRPCEKTHAPKGMPQSILELKHNDHDRIHFARCCKGPAACSQCVFAVHKVDWMQRYLWPSRGKSWIEVRRTGNFAIGCQVCKQVGKGKAFGLLRVRKNLTSSRFLNHERTRDHRDALRLGDGEVTLTQLEVDRAPSLEAFKQTLKDTWTCNSSTRHATVGKQKKVRKMKWALAEARREWHRQALQNASTLSLHQDATGGTIALRFTCCGFDLQPHSGVLGLCNVAKHYSLDSCGVKSATLQILRDICTPILRPPYKMTGELDKALHQHLLGIVELWDTDAAEDEVLAGKLLQSEHHHDVNVRIATGAFAFYFSSFWPFYFPSSPHGLCWEFREYSWSPLLTPRLGYLSAFGKVWASQLQCLPACACAIFLGFPLRAYPTLLPYTMFTHALLSYRPSNQIIRLTLFYLALICTLVYCNDKINVSINFL